MPMSVACVASNALNPNMGRVTRLTALWSCSIVQRVPATCAASAKVAACRAKTTKAVSSVGWLILRRTNHQRRHAGCRGAAKGNQPQLGIQKELCIPGGRWWVDDIHTPLFEVWKPLELRFAPAHRLLGPLHARLIRGGHPLYNRMAPVPCHGTGQR